jgi:hypothetical protein
MVEQVSRLTEADASSLGQRAGFQSMQRAGRTSWSVEDFQAAQTVWSAAMRLVREGIIVQPKGK